MTDELQPELVPVPRPQNPYPLHGMPLSAAISGLPVIRPEVATTTIVLSVEQFGKIESPNIILYRKMNWALIDQGFEVYIPGPGWHHRASQTDVLFPHFQYDETGKAMYRRVYCDYADRMADLSIEDRTISGEAEILAKFVAVLDSI